MQQEPEPLPALRASLAAAIQQARARAHALHHLGCNVTAIAHDSKGPMYPWKKGYPQRQNRQDVDHLPWNGYATRDERTIPPSTRVGIIHGPDGCGGIRAFDIDAATNDQGEKIPVSEELAHLLSATLGIPDDTPWLRRSTSGAGWHLFFVCHDDIPADLFTENGKEKGVFPGFPRMPDTFDHLELRWAGCQTVFNGAVPDSPPPVVPIERVVAAFHAVAMPTHPQPPHETHEPETHATSPRQSHKHERNNNRIKDTIKDRLDLLETATHLFGDQTEPAGPHEVRLLGNGGLIVNTQKHQWYCHTQEIGGDVFDLISYYHFDTTLNGDTERFKDVLGIAANLAGVALPEHVPRLPNRHNGHHPSSPTTGPGPDRPWTKRSLDPDGASTCDDAAVPPTGLPPDRIRLVHADDMDRLPDLDWIVDAILPRGVVAQIFGAPGEGKSHVLLDLALTVAQHAPVVYIAAEDELQYKPRLRAWCRHHGLGRGHLYFWVAPLNLFDPVAINHFLASIAPLHPVLVVLDPLAQCGAGSDLDNTRDMTLAVEGLHTIRTATGGTVLVCHHTGWSGDHERGSSVLRGACRTVYKLTNDDGLIKMTCEKMNNAPKAESRSFRLVEQDVTGEDGLPRTSVVLVPSHRMAMEHAPVSEKQLQVLEALLLETLREATFAQLQEYTEQKKSTLHHSLSRLIQRGCVEELSGTNRKLYRLAEAGRTVLEEQTTPPTESGAPTGPPGLNWEVRFRAVRSGTHAADTRTSASESALCGVSDSPSPVVRSESGGGPVDGPVVRSGAPPGRGHRTPDRTDHGNQPDVGISSRIIPSGSDSNPDTGDGNATNDTTQDVLHVQGHTPLRNGWDRGPQRTADGPHTEERHAVLQEQSAVIPSPANEPAAQRIPATVGSIQEQVEAGKITHRARCLVAEHQFIAALHEAETAPRVLRDSVIDRVNYLIALMDGQDRPRGWEWRSTYLLERHRDGFRTTTDVNRGRVVAEALKVELAEAEATGHFDARPP